MALGALLVASSIRLTLPQRPTDAARSLSTEAATVMALGRESAMATVLWMRTADRFASGGADAEWIASSLHTIGALDPTWVEPWFFGILMLPDTQTELRQQLLSEAAELHPEVPWFAWRAGMAQLGDNREVALEWLRRASRTPGADPAYRELLDALEAR